MRGSCGLRPPEYGVGVRRAPRDRGHLPEGGISGLSTCHVLPPPECPQMSFGVKSMCVPESGGARVQKKPRQPRRAGQGEGEVPGQSRWAAMERPQAVPGGPSPKAIHRGEAFLATMEGTNGVSREVIGRGDGLSRTRQVGLSEEPPGGHASQPGNPWDGRSRWPRLCPRSAPRAQRAGKRGRRQVRRTSARRRVTHPTTPGAGLKPQVSLRLAGGGRKKLKWMEDLNFDIGLGYTLGYTS